MRVHTVVVASALGMLASSALAWTLSPEGTNTASAAEVATPTDEAAPVAAAPEEAPAEVRPEASFEVPGALRVEARLANETLTADRLGETYVMVSLTGQEELAGAPVTPADVTIVVDRSGSMRGDRMDTALAAASGMVSQLRDGDTVSVIAYDGDAEVLVPPTRLDSRTRVTTLASVRNVGVGGNTCLSCGVERALQLVPRRGDSVHRVLVLSDGKANRGLKDIRDFSGIASTARATQTAVSSIGVGVDYDERLLSSLSRGTNGNHYFVDRLDQLREVFARELDAVAQTVAASAEVEVALAPGVEVLEVLERSATRAGNKVRVPFGSFRPGEVKTLLMRVRLPRQSEGIADVADVALRYTDAVTGQRERADGRLQVGFGDATDRIHPVVEARLAQSETVDTLQRVNDLIDAGRDRDARLALEEGRSRVKKRRSAATSHPSAKPSPAASRNFELQEDAFDSAASGLIDLERATKNQSRDAPRKRKATTKQNAMTLNPFG